MVDNAILLEKSKSGAYYVCSATDPDGFPLFCMVSTENELLACPLDVVAYK